MRCTNCGQELAEHAKFCNRCGTPTAAKGQQESLETEGGFGGGEKPEKKGKGRYVLLTLMILVVFAAGAGGAVLGLKAWREWTEGSRNSVVSESDGKKSKVKSEDEEDENGDEDGGSDEKSDRDSEESREDDSPEEGEKGREPAGDESEASGEEAKGAGESGEENTEKPVSEAESEAAGAASETTEYSPAGAEEAETAAENPEMGTENPEGGSAAAPPVTMDRVDLVMASSSLSEYNMTHSPERLYDGDLSSAWVEGAEGQGIGESVTFCFDETCLVTGFVIYGGYQKSSDLYQKNSRPAKLRVFIPGYDEMVYSLEDWFGVQDIPLVTPVETKEITFTIQEVYPGSKYEDTVISELTFY